MNAMVSHTHMGEGNRCLEMGVTEEGIPFVVTQLDLDDRSIRPGGLISGPAQFAAADLALWYLSFIAVDRIEPMALTAELSIRFMNPAIGTSLICRAELDASNSRRVVGSTRTWTVEHPETITSVAQGTYVVPAKKEA